MSEQPAVSVVMAARNAERWLGEALHSMCTQTYHGLEVVVVDDASTDTTPQILARYPDPRLRTIRLETNAGVAGALNAGLRAARGTYVARMDADDVSLPERISQQVAYLRARPEVGIVGGNMLPVDQAGEPAAAPTDLPVLPGHVAWMLPVHNCVNHPTVLARRDILLSVGGYRHETVPAEDYDLFVRASAVTAIANVPDVVLRYRLHPESISAARAMEAARAAQEVSERAVAAVMGEPPDRAALRILRCPEDAASAAPDAVRDAADLLWAYTRTVMSRRRPTDAERAAIRRSAVGWLIRMVRAEAGARPATSVGLLLPGRGRPPGWVLRESLAAGTRRATRTRAAFSSRS
jgi:hypothetical protein